MTLIGRRLGSYQVDSLLGAGGMGEVYRARDTRLGREVAIKILPESIVADRERLARFEREARLLASLNHQNIAQIYGLEGQEGRERQEGHSGPFIVMELVAGDTVADKLTGSRGLPVAEVLLVAHQIINALETAHERGIVHRDLKPANIKITPDGVVKVLDFGLAKADAETATSDLSHSPTITADHTKDGVILGTAAYMSPEQARGRAVDKRTDIWAFGCVLYEMLTGRCAFQRETVSDTIAAILQNEPDWGQLPATTPASWRRLLQRCLQKDVRVRLRDIGDARYDLDAPSEAAVLTVAPSQVASRAWLWPLSALVILGLGAAATWTMQPRAAASASAPHLSPAIRVTNTLAEEFGPAISPDGKWLAYYSNTKGRTDLMVKYLDSGATLNLTASQQLELPVRTGIGGVAISPDGTQISFAARIDPQLAGYDTWTIPGPVGGVPHKLLSGIPAIQWSPDGRQLAYAVAGSTRGDLLVVASFDGTGGRTLVEREGGRHIHWFTWSRDGQYLYFIATYDTWHTEPSATWRVPVKGGPAEVVLDTARRAIYPVPLPSGALLFAANPNTLDLGLWWRGPNGGEPVALTNGLGEHTESRASADGRRIVTTRLSKHQAIASIVVSAGSPIVQNLTDGFGGDLDPSSDRQTGRIVFSSSRAGSRNLWIAKADGSDAVPLTTGTAIDERPSFSPDGQQIAFVSDRDSKRGIWVMSAQGGAPKLLAHETVLDTLTWSRDGQRIMFARPGGPLPALASVSASGGTVESVKLPTEGGYAPGLSPIDDTVAYLEPAMVPLPPPDTGPGLARNRITFMDRYGAMMFPELPRLNTNYGNGFLAWAPDGKRVAVASVSANAQSQIWIIEPDSKQSIRKLIDFPIAVRPRGLTWSKDGERVIFGSQEFNGDLVMYDLDR
jgi:Tol biopolymer transport system component